MTNREIDFEMGRMLGMKLPEPFKDQDPNSLCNDKAIHDAMSTVILRKIPLFTSDVLHDYTVLVHIRANWGREARYRFANATARKWSERDCDDPLLQYQPGDWSRFAMEVLNDMAVEHELTNR